MGLFHELTDTQREAKVREWREIGQGLVTPLHTYLGCTRAELAAWWPGATQANGAPHPATLSPPAMITGSVQSSNADDLVIHPPHYTNHPSGVECITVAEHFGFNLGNVIKYIWRSPLKGSTVQDLEKARWYLDREIANLKAGSAGCQPPGAGEMTDA